jgi:Cu(I)/Ag(I) efflux system membrane fusion protein
MEADYMKRSAKIVGLAILVAVAFLAGHWHNVQKQSTSSAFGGRRILYYHDPMHPAYKANTPGIAPDCGMQLEPVYEGESGLSQGAGEGNSVPAGSVQLTAQTQQLIGVKVATVEKVSESHTLRVLGRVVPDETRLYRINAATDGWVREILPLTTGSLVRKEDLLAKIYAPESFSAMKAYLYGLRSLDRFKDDSQETKDQIDLTDANIENYRNALRNLGMADSQLDEIARTRQGANVIEIRAIETGFILSRNVSLGQRFEKGAELFRIADLRHVWILADLFENEAHFVRAGQTAQVFYQGKSFPAKMSDVLPQFDAATRTLKVRFETDNSGYPLRPDMFVDLEFPVQLPAAVTVPVESVLDSGLKKTVFVDHGNGYFEPRLVRTGWRLEGRVAIIEGLEAGDRIVVSGNFLIDSESRMKAQGDQASFGQRPGKDLAFHDPVCGMQVDPAKPGGKLIHEGKTYFFCSSTCKEKFEARAL